MRSAAVTFSGAGGSSQGLHDAGYRVDLAINHNAKAIAAHAANFPGPVVCGDVFEYYPERVWGRSRPLDALWASPSCTHFSRALGDKPRNEQERSGAETVLHWARAVQPRVIFLENVREFLTWGPLLGDGRPDPACKGEYFSTWLANLRLLGYRVSWRVLRACDYGAPTIRQRLYLIARRDGVEPRWPEPTHGPGRARPWRTAAECIDWSLPCRSIFERSKPLAAATMARITEGLRRFVLECPKPFIVNGHRAAFLTSYYSGGGTAQALSDPMAAIVTRARHGLVVVELGGQPYALRDITLRMLAPQELAAAQGFPAGFKFIGNTADQIRQIGNAVCPPVAKAIAEANL